MFSSIKVIGIKKLTSNLLITSTSKDARAVKAEFSKSDIYISIGRNSTLQPMSEETEGGGLNRREFQLVDCKFSKCSVVSSSLTTTEFEKTTMASRTNKAAM
jgi:hypothetical protein